MPFADYLLFRHPALDRILLNIGGIANLTYLRANASLNEVIAFDTGPGNCISDWICREKSAGNMSWDMDGAGAAGGNVIEPVADRFLAHSYFKAQPPKSTDGPAMIAAFTEALGTSNPDLNDLLATAASVTATPIAQAICRVLPEPNTRPVELIVSGGGLHNQAIMRGLLSRLPSNVTWRSSDDFAMPPDAREAVAFALLGAATLDGFPSNIPAVTGARKAVVLGTIAPQPV